MKKICKNLKEHATKIINYEKKRNDTINKGGKENISQTKKILYMQKKV